MSPRMEKRDVDLLPIKTCQEGSLFQHSSARFSLPHLIGTCFLSTCTPKPSQRILLPFLRGGDRMWKVDKALKNNAPLPLRAHTHTFTLWHEFTLIYLGEGNKAVLNRKMIWLCYDIYWGLWQVGKFETGWHRIMDFFPLHVGILK